MGGWDEGWYRLKCDKWCAYSLSLSEDDIEEQANDGKENACTSQNGIDDEEILVDLTVSSLWGAIRRNTI